MGDHSHSTHNRHDSIDLLTLIALIGIIAQTILFVLISFKIVWAIRLPDSIPDVAKKIAVVFIGILCLNSGRTWLKVGEQRCQTIAYFTVLLLMVCNTIYGQAVRKNLKYELDMQILIKQSRQQYEAYMTLLKQQEEHKKEAEIKRQELQDSKELKAKTSVLAKRMLEERIKSLEESIEQLSFENQEMRKKGISAKKEK